MLKTNKSNALGSFFGGLGRRAEPFVTEERGLLEVGMGKGSRLGFVCEYDSELGDRVGAFGLFGLNPVPLLTS